MGGYPIFRRTSDSRLSSGWPPSSALRRRALEGGWQDTAGRADLAAEWVDSVFAISDMALQGLDELNHSPQLATRAESVDPSYEALEALLAARRDRSTFLDELGLLDARGRIVVSSTSVLPQGFDLSGMPYVQRFQREPERQEWISGLYWTAFAADYRVMHARRFEGGAGLQAHFALVRLSPRVFDDALSRLSMGKGKSLVLLDTEARLVARRPACEGPGCATVGERLTDLGLQAMLAGIWRA